MMGAAMSHIHAHIKKLQAILPTDCAVFVNFGQSIATDNLFYLFGEKITPAACIVPKKGKPHLCIGGFEYDRFKTSLGEMVHLHKLESKKGFLPYLRGTIGYDAARLPIPVYQMIRNQPHKDIQNTIRRLRAIKSDYELTCLRTAGAITARIFQKLSKKSFTHEKQIKRFLLRETVSYDCEPAFDPVVASGKRAADPHYSGCGRLLKGFCVVDYGVRYKGYRADVTRTFFYGQPSGQEKLQYTKVLKAQQKALEKYQTCYTPAQAHAAAANQLGGMIHAVGHGLGLDVHEAPFVGPGTHDLFEKHMVATCEPGIYCPRKLGIRIEDDVIITSGKPEVITNVSRTLVCWK